MTSIRSIIKYNLLVLAIIFLSPASASAQEFTESHLAAARAAATNSPISRNFDTILPGLVQRVQNRLISVRPDLHEAIAVTVKDVALRLVSRRSDLDAATALLWARAFTEEELVAISTFFESDVGTKFVALGSELRDSTLKAVDNWSSRVGEELLDKSREDLRKLGHEF